LLWRTRFFNCMYSSRQYRRPSAPAGNLLLQFKTTTHSPYSVIKRCEAESLSTEAFHGFGIDDISRPLSSHTFCLRPSGEVALHWFYLLLPLPSAPQPHVRRKLPWPRPSKHGIACNPRRLAKNRLQAAANGNGRLGHILLRPWRQPASVGQQDVSHLRSLGGPVWKKLYINSNSLPKCIAYARAIIHEKNQIEIIWKSFCFSCDNSTLQVDNYCVNQSHKIDFSRKKTHSSLPVVLLTASLLLVQACRNKQPPRLPDRSEFWT
jgi:hypothetical protein